MAKKVTNPTAKIEKPVISISVDVFKKVINENEIAININASVSGNKKEIKDFFIAMVDSASKNSFQFSDPFPNDFVTPIKPS